MIFKNELPSGLRVAGEVIPGFNSVSIGVWIGTGSIHENGKEAGISHFIEHMLFKSTKNRTASQIAIEMDSIGGNLNAFTAKECTCYHAKVLGSDIETAISILGDMIHNPLLDPADIEREKNVVCEEILMMQDSPEDVAHESLCELYYEGKPLAGSIAGTQESVRAFTENDIRGYMSKRYNPGNIVVACAGNFDPDKLMEIVERELNGKTGGSTERKECGDYADSRKFRFTEKDTEQAHICIGLPGVELGNDLQYALHIANSCLGGSMSSRLFQNIREERGLAYSVYSYLSQYRTTGYCSLYAGMGMGQAETVLRLMLEELRRMKQNGITDDEFLRAKAQLKNSFLLGQESTGSRSSSLGKSLLIRDKIYAPEEILTQLESVTSEKVNEAIGLLVDFDKMSAVLVGRSENDGAICDNIKNMILTYA